MAFAIENDYLYDIEPTSTDTAIYDISDHSLTSTSTTNTNPSSNSFKMLFYNGSTYINLFVTRSVTGEFSQSFTCPSNATILVIAFNGNMKDRKAFFSVSDLGLVANTNYIVTGNITILDRTNTGNDAKVVGLTITEAALSMHTWQELYESMSTVSDALTVGQVSYTADSNNKITSPSALNTLYTYQCILKSQCSDAGCDVDTSTINYSNSQAVRFCDLSKHAFAGYHFGTTGTFDTMTATRTDGTLGSVSQTSTYSDINDVLNNTMIPTTSTYSLNSAFIVLLAGTYEMRLKKYVYNTSTNSWDYTGPDQISNVTATQSGSRYKILKTWTGLQADYIVTFSNPL